MLHQLCGDIVYATKVSLNTSVKHHHRQCQLENLLILYAFENEERMLCFFHLFYHHAVLTF